jgi:hypothetical protein
VYVWIKGKYKIKKSKQIISSRKHIAEDSELRSQVEMCEKRLNELRVTEQLLNA